MKANIKIASFILGLVFIPSFLFGQGIRISSNAYVIANSGYVVVSGNLVNSGGINLQTGTFTMSGNYTNSGIYTQGTGSIVFNGQSQVLSDNGSGTMFTNVLFNGNGGSGNPAVMSSGNFTVSSTGVLNMVNTTSLNANGNLTLNSAATSSATVAVIPSGASITGNVNVQRFITGGSGYRGYRLLSSPVYGTTVSSNNVYSINYLKNSSYLTGTTGTGGGFDKAGNPTLYLYRENLVPSNSSFISGNFRAVNTIGTAPNFGYLIDGDAGTFNIPVGNGFFFFFRGDKSVTTLAAETTPAYMPTNTTLTASGTLNTGQIIVKGWYTPASPNLGWTNITANTSVRGYNLVGNPYASSIDWENYNTTTTTTGIYVNNVGTTIYEFNPKTKNFDSYQKGGAHTNNGSSIIASGQGFFVVATCSCAQLIFNESAKTTTQNTGLNLFMATKADVATIGNAGHDQHLRLQLAEDSVHTDDIYIGFNPDAKTQYVFNEDAAYKKGNGTVSLASISSDNEALAINKQPFPKQSAVIGLEVNTQADGIYSLSMTEIKEIPELFDIWLMDAFKSDSLDMRHNATYTFNVLKSDTNTFGSKRFSLVIRQNPAYAYHLLNFTAARVANAVQVTWKTENEQNYTNFTVERSIDNGKTFEVIGSIASSGAGNYGLPDKTPFAGQNLYRLKQEDINNAITYSNVVQVLYANTSNKLATSNISIYPNPAINMINLTITPKSQEPTFYNVMVSNSSGIIVKQATLSQPSWQTGINNLLPGTYLLQVVNNKDKSLVGQLKFVKL